MINELPQLAIVVAGAFVLFQIFSFFKRIKDDHKRAKLYDADIQEKAIKEGNKLKSDRKLLDDANAELRKRGF